jgi:hypothetical protein
MGGGEGREEGFLGSLQVLHFSTDKVSHVVFHQLIQQQVQLWIWYKKKADPKNMDPSQDGIGVCEA